MKPKNLRRLGRLFFTFSFGSKGDRLWWVSDRKGYRVTYWCALVRVRNVEGPEAWRPWVLFFGPIRVACAYISRAEGAATVERVHAAGGL